MSSLRVIKEPRFVKEAVRQDWIGPYLVSTVYLKIDDDKWFETLVFNKWKPMHDVVKTTSYGVASMMHDNFMRQIFSHTSIFNRIVWLIGRFFKG